MTNSAALIVTPIIPFPNILWWAYMVDHDAVCFEKEEHYQKMSYRNRYYIGGSNGMIQLSIPLVHGRNQRTAVKDVRISNDTAWQTQHWRTIISVYKRAPYFDFYEPTLQPLFEKQFNFLVDFNLASIHWLKQHVGFQFAETETAEYIKQYENAVDLRQSLKPGTEGTSANNASKYYQVFEDRTGFLQNLSLLDLLFSEGPHTKRWINANKAAILQWGKSAI